MLQMLPPRTASAINAIASCGSAGAPPPPGGGGGYADVGGVDGLAAIEYDDGACEGGGASSDGPWPWEAQEADELEASGTYGRPPGGPDRGAMD